MKIEYIKLYSKFIVTGKTTDGKRFQKVYAQENARWAFGINLWRGSVWGVKVSDGKRKLLKRVFNL